MTNTLAIRPSKELRNNYSKISSLCREEPVAITVNGKEDTVILSHEDFMNQQSYIDELEARIEVYEHLAQAMDDIKLGRCEDVKTAFDDIFSFLDNYEVWSYIDWFG